jgi:hypothetical protein
MKTPVPGSSKNKFYIPLKQKAKTDLISLLHISTFAH